MPHKAPATKTRHPKMTTDCFLKITSLQAEQVIISKSACKEIQPGLVEHQIDIELARVTTPSPVAIEWCIPLIDISGKWHPLIKSDRSLTSGWCEYVDSYATKGAPVFSLFSESGENRQTFALSDAINPIQMRVQVEEDTAEVKCEVILFEAPTEPLDHYSLTILIDTRAIPHYEALAQVSQWWEAMPLYKPAPVPAQAYAPVYSTWYSFHQELTENAIETCCKWSQAMGCQTVIVDDGWQTDDSNKGYQFCGDWEIARTKFPNFSAHVKRVQALDMRYMLWFSVPYAGLASQAWKTFEDRTLPKPFDNAACLDPRYPQVRAYLIEFYRRAIQEWQLDGLKLDFVDQFTAEVCTTSDQEIADMRSVPAAADRLLSDMMTQLQVLNPEVLIEFRQNYIGPAMRKYGNILRANDCPNDALSNRVRTIDLRLLAGSTAVHSDMIMWNRNESPERAALQLWATLFSVPQISVKPEDISKQQNQMLRFYLKFWNSHRELLMHGDFKPSQPQYLYPVVKVESADATLIALYQNNHIVDVSKLRTRKLTVVNATESRRLVIDLGEQAQSYQVKAYDCMGQPTANTQIIKQQTGLYSISMPASGVADLSPIDTHS